MNGWWHYGMRWEPGKWCNGWYHEGGTTLPVSLDLIEVGGRVVMEWSRNRGFLRP